MILATAVSVAVSTLFSPAATAIRSEPLPELTESQEAEFREGFAAFRDMTFPNEGLGPVYNAQQCYNCHSNPLGGLSARKRAIVTRFGRNDAGVFDPLTHLGGPLLQSKSLSKECRETVPAEANVVAQRVPTSMMGGGLIEAIPDQQIIDRAIAQQLENPAMAGRVHVVTSVSDGLPHVGRFGWKAQWALIPDAVADAMLNELGMTNALFPSENAPNGDPDLLAQCDTVPEIEDTDDFLGRFTHLVRYLAPPPPRRARQEENPRVVQGKALFHAIGCAFCHSNGYTTESTIPALDGKSIPLYSDLLLHDIGTGDGIVQGDAQGNEFRTPPLSIDTKSPYLHDGRARNMDDAVDAHRGQALAIRDAYFALSKAERKTIRKFLKFK